MVDLPVAGFFTTAAPSNLEAKQALDDMVAFSRARVGGGAPAVLTIAAGSITPNSGTHWVDTEAAAATDDLSNIVTTNLADGSLLLLQRAVAGHAVVVKHAAGGPGEINLDGAADYTLTQTRWLLLIRSGVEWYEIRLR
jgi:hypothetical protein